MQASVVRGRPSGPESSQDATAKQLGLDSTSRPPEAARKIQSMTANPKFIGLIPFSSANAENPGAKTGKGTADGASPRFRRSTIDLRLLAR